MQAQVDQVSGFTRTPTIVRRRRLVEEHSDLVRMVAYQVARRNDLDRCSLDIEDLFSVGILGLFEAEKRFDDATGCPFRSFAEFRIKGAMLDEIRRRDTMPRRLRAANIKVSRAAESVRMKTGRTATSQELSELTGMSVERVLVVQRRADTHRRVSSETMMSMPSDFRGPDEVIELRERYEQLSAAIASLKDRQQLVLDLYFQREMTLREIADILGVTEGRVCQIKGAAIKELRAMLTES